MIQISIPGYKVLNIKNLVMDFNGTMAEDGKMIPGLKARLEILKEICEIFVITADTFGSVESELKDLPVRIRILDQQNQIEAKREFIHQLGASGCACIGNGRNDSSMLDDAALGIIVLQKEGASVFAISKADIITGNIIDALDLLIFPKRLIATLRS